MNLKVVWGLLKETFTEWNEDKASRLAAALAYYTIFSLAPLLIIVIAIAAIAFGEEAARGQVVGQIQGLMGQQGAEAVEGMIAHANRQDTGPTAAVIGLVTLLVGASGVFAQLQDALNTIWEVAPKPGQGIKHFIQNRVLSFAMVLVIGFLLLVSLVISAVLAGVGAYMSHLLPGLAPLWEIVNFAISFGVITLLFGMIYRILPDAKIAWGDVWIGAAVTALLFTIGRTLIGIYLGQAAVGSAYGAAGSLVIVLVWVFYSAQILLFGAEFTQVYARRYGSRIRPADHAVPLTEEGMIQEGIPRSEYVKSIEASMEQRNRSQERPSEQPDRANRSDRSERSQPGASERSGRSAIAEAPIEESSTSQGSRSNHAATVLGTLFAVFGAVQALRGSRRGGRSRRRR